MRAEVRTELKTMKKKGNPNAVADMRRGIQLAKETVAAAVAVDAVETEDLSFSTRRKVESPWVQLLDRLGDLKPGQALKLAVPKMPTSLLAAARKRDIKLEFCERDGFTWVREKSVGAL